MGFWAFIIPILVQLLASFLTSLLKNLNPPVTPGLTAIAPALPNFALTRSQFLNQLKWKFWLGPKRYQYAGALHDKMVAQFAVHLSSGRIDVPSTVSQATTGLASLKPSDLGDV